MTTLELLSPDVLKASKSPLIWTLGSHAALKHFHLRHWELKDAQSLALETDPELVRKALNERAGARLERCVLRNETKFPFIHRKFIEGERAVELAKRYRNKRQGAAHGKPLTRCRIYQIGEEFKKWAERAHKGDVNKALTVLESLVTHPARVLRRRR